MAITIDDAPMTSAYLRSECTLEATLYRLLAKIRRAQVPVMPFVNEGSVYAGTNTARRRTEWLTYWVEVAAGMGNHTYSHMNLGESDPADFETDIVKGELITERLLCERNIQERYFRYPYLNMGKSLAIKRRVDAFLRDKNYRIAPVTLNSDDSLFSLAYDIAELNTNSKEMKRIGAAYLGRLALKIEQAKYYSHALFQRPIADIMLTHASLLTADYFQQVIDLLRAAGYSLISLDEALQDPVYALPDDAYDAEHLGQIQRMWAALVAPGVAPPPRLAMPDFVTQVRA